MKNPPLSVLIIDDNLLFADRLSHLLAEINIQSIDIANNYFEALQKLETFIPDIIFIDINLPGRDGIELIKKIKQYNFSYNIIVLTSQADNHTKSIYKEIGIFSFVDKSNDLDNLPEIINRIHKD
ncbi:MAG: response regulator [Bacteroidota bacterium]